MPLDRLWTQAKQRRRPPRRWLRTSCCLSRGKIYIPRVMCSGTLVCARGVTGCFRHEKRTILHILRKTRSDDFTSGLFFFWWEIWKILRKTFSFPLYDRTYIYIPIRGITSWKEKKNFTRMLYSFTTRIYAVVRANRTSTVLSFVADVCADGFSRWEKVRCVMIRGLDTSVRFSARIKPNVYIGNLVSETNSIYIQSSSRPLPESYDWSYRYMIAAALCSIVMHSSYPPIFGQKSLIYWFSMLSHRVYNKIFDRWDTYQREI